MCCGAGVGRGVLLHAVQGHKAPGGQGPSGRSEREGQVHAQRQPPAARGRGVPHAGENSLHTSNRGGGSANGIPTKYSDPEVPTKSTRVVQANRAAVCIDF